ncbi:MAG: hypothetical protein JFAIHJKO_02782 [Pyrinomonadaceae bacterium]|nr:hypothetical protein [Pyrinomonadaceae bacterium]
MSIIIALLLGLVGGFMFGAVWRAEELEALQKANARLIEERDQARNNKFTPRTRTNWAI